MENCPICQIKVLQEADQCPQCQGNLLVFRQLDEIEQALEINSTDSTEAEKNKMSETNQREILERINQIEQKFHFPTVKQTGMGPGLNRINFQSIFLSLSMFAVVALLAWIALERPLANNIEQAEASRKIEEKSPLDRTLPILSAAIELAQQSQQEVSQLRSENRQLRKEIIEVNRKLTEQTALNSESIAKPTKSIVEDVL